MNKFLTLLFLLNSLIVYSQELKKKKLYSIDTYGTTIYQDPDFESQKIKKIDFGTTVILLRDSLMKVDKTYYNNFKLSGHWVKVQYNETIGYACNTDFTSKPLLSLKTNKKLGLTLNHFLGKEISNEIIIDSVSIDGKMFQKKKTITKYENGEVIEEPFDGCWNDYYRFYNNTMSEIYHLIMNLDDFKYEDTIFPIYREVENGRYKFQSLGWGEFYLWQPDDNKGIMLYITGCN